MPTYSIANWERFETCETRKLEVLKWVPTPNKHDGLGFRTMAMERNALELFGAWNAILQVASRGRGADRGRLMRDGRPVGARELAMMTGFPQSAFERALIFFSSPEMGWLVCDECRDVPPSTVSPAVQAQETPVSPAESPARPGPSPARAGGPPAEGIEGKEGNGRKEREGADAPDSSGVPRKTLRMQKARPLLFYLNEKAGRNYRETEANLVLIAARLEEVNDDVEGVKRMIDRMCAKWKADPKFSEYLQPMTLFGKQKFGGYYDNRDLPVASESTPSRPEPKQIQESLTLPRI